MLFPALWNLSDSISGSQGGGEQLEIDVKTVSKYWEAYGFGGGCCFVLVCLFAYRACVPRIVCRCQYPLALNGCPAQ
jgi:hypothetical protein